MNLKLNKSSEFIDFYTDEQGKQYIHQKFDWIEHDDCPVCTGVHEIK